MFVAVIVIGPNTPNEIGVPLNVVSESVSHSGLLLTEIVGFGIPVLAIL
jgi:hypothetical protein